MEYEPSAVSHPVPGYPPSGLTDPERIALGDLAVANTMRAIGCDEDTARELLGGYAAQDRVTISGDRRLVGLFVDETLFALADRTWSAASPIPAATSTAGVVLSPVSLVPRWGMLEVDRAESARPVEGAAGHGSDCRR